ncbi:TetR family transcriptional regulator C-terminal domain-containing protein [Ammonicoccus fulvus]|uniref:TetR family transcriptional regulator C-terminal domain-containing protein n=1 Tax=Ammonicoccus fulvus TaxID=3138240 RepID=A0ABZ3FNE8_9ACTN
MPRVVDHTGRHGAIAQAVWALIARGGIETVTLRAVAAEAGMSLGQVQHYVDNKADLIRRACAAMIERAEATYRRDAPEADPLGSVRTILVHPFARTASAQAGVRVWLGFIAKSVDDAGIAELINEAKAGTEDEIARLLEAASADPSLARTLVALSDGLAERTLTGAITPLEAESAIDRALQLLCAAARPGA